MSETIEFPMEGSFQQDSCAGEVYARRRAWDVEESWIVEAPAGSGKTELLMQRFLRLLARVDQPEEVLAITFTRKAAAEMRDRILESLRDAETNIPLDPAATHKLKTREFAREALATNAKFGWNLVRQPHRLNIRTIDSLCSEIADRLPILSRLGIQMRPVDDASALYHAAARATLKQMGGDDDRLRLAIHQLLLHLDNKVDQVECLISGMLANRDHWVHHFPIERARSDEALDDFIRQEFEVPLQDAADQVLRCAFATLPPETWKQIFTLAHHAAKELDGSQQKNIFLELLTTQDVPPCNYRYISLWKTAARLLLTDKGSIRKLRGIAKVGFASNLPHTVQLKTLLGPLQGNKHCEQALSRLAAMPSPVYTDQQRTVLRSIFILLRHALAELRLQFAFSGTSDFLEIALAASYALNDEPGSLTLAFGTAIRHLLVDEVQDTSITQFEMLAKLVQGWDGHSQTVFLVGDPKQSIYRFRHAEVSLFYRVCREGLGGVSLQQLRLRSNFRSLASLVCQTNEMFSEIFAGMAEDNAEVIRFEPSEPTHLEEKISRLHWHTHILPAKAKNHGEDASEEDDPRIVEARQVCDAIQAHRAHVPPGEKPPGIAILVRARKHMAFILQEMDRRGIRYRAVEMDVLADRQPVLDVMAIARALLHPADRIAWLAVLRAPWCGLTLADLLMLCGNDEPGWNTKTIVELFHERASLLSQDGFSRAQSVLRILEAARGQTGDGRFSLLVERTWHTLGGPHCIDPKEWPAVQGFLQMLDTLQDQGDHLTAARLESQMAKLHAPLSGCDDSAVEVLTLFKAKGLEWDIVLMPGLHRGTGKNPTRLTEWMEQAVPAGDPGDTELRRVFLAPILQSGEENEGITKWIKAMNGELDREELKRLLYVGCTRARRQVHLFATCRKKKDGALGGVLKGTLLQTAWPIAKATFMEDDAKQVAASASNVVPMPLRESPGDLDSVAAAGETAPTSTVPLSNFYRVAAGWQPPAVPRDVPSVSPERTPEGIGNEIGKESGPAFVRPQGSWRARVFGTVLHVFLGPLAQLLAHPTDPDTAVAAISGFHQPIRLQFMRNGYESKEAEKEALRIIEVLQHMVQDPIGRWILASHPEPGAADLFLTSTPGFEVPLTGLDQGILRSIRIDRLFLAGESPETPGKDVLWIVDFKTASYSSVHLESFLKEQQKQYEAQMRIYANIAHAVYPDIRRFHLGLYYPLLRRLMWWPHEDALQG